MSLVLKYGLALEATSQSCLQNGLDERYPRWPNCVLAIESRRKQQTSRNGKKRMLTIELPGDPGYLSDLILCEPVLPKIVGYRMGLRSVFQT